MTRIVSVVTAVHGPSVGFLPDAYASLADQVLPAGWGWQWLVQEDGTTGRPRDVLPGDPRISVGTGRPLGQGIARTYALARAEGELVKVFFEVPGGEVRARAVVRISEPGKGMGIEFTAMSTEARGRIHQLIKRLLGTPSSAGGSE